MQGPLQLPCTACIFLTPHPLLSSSPPPPGDFPSLVNSEIVAIQRVQTAAGEAHLRGLIEAHVARTGSAKGQAILADWAAALPRFWQLVPPSEANSPQASKAADEEAQAGGVAGGVAVAASA